MKNYDVIIIGAGSAGLSALNVVRKKTENVLLIDQGPLGTTCARVGCMPSKALLQAAHDYHRSRRLNAQGLVKGEWKLDRPALMKHVRAMRDHFVSFVLRDIDALGERFQQGRAQFIGPDAIRIDGTTEARAKAIIIATGSEPIIPDPFKAFRKHIVTTDDFFELEDLPERWAVIGLGPIGLEIGQALAWLGCPVSGYDTGRDVAGLKDPEVNAAAISALQEDMSLTLGRQATLEEQGGRVQVLADGRRTVDKVLVAVGRRPRVHDLGLENTGCRLDAKGNPCFDPKTAAVEGAPLFIVGDADSKAPIQHEAVADGRRAAHNALRTKPEEVAGSVRLGIVFTEPNIVSVGRAFDDVGDAVIGDAAFEDQGRSKIMGRNVGRLRVYAERASGRIIGAEMAAPAAEHMGLLLASFVQTKTTLAEALRLPFYHPTIEEGLRTALRDAEKKIKK